MKRNLALLILILITFSACIVLGKSTVLANSQMLDVGYEACIAEKNADGVYEMWYLLEWESEYYHLIHDETTIKYYFADTTEKGIKFIWGNHVMEDPEVIKNAFTNSMKKWNNVYFYSYDDNGHIVEHKVINVIEGTETDHNLIIYPNVSDEEDGPIAITYKSEGKTEIEVEGDISHNHYSEWEMVVYVNHFARHKHNTDAEVNCIRNRTGAHEVGHILGLFDIDVEDLCYSGSNDDGHHHELLMGYGLPIENRSSNITYKDIAGVAITRGFHTDSDHKWLLYDQPITGIYKLVCSICNGIKVVQNIADYSVELYGLCNNNHNLSSGNMMAVARYGNKDYYKCKYCRYVAPFDNLVTQNYVATPYSNIHHKYTNAVSGLEYSFLGEHSFTNRYERYSSGQHKAYCECGDIVYQPHVASANTGVLGSTCKYCGELLMFSVLDSISSNYPHTENGSYILPNGIIVLVPEDEEAYLNGTLEFRTGEVM